MTPVRRKQRRRDDELPKPEDVTMPHNLEVECSVLGSMLLSTEAAQYAADTIDTNDFWRAAHQLIFDAAKALVADNRPVDLPALREVLRQRGHEDEVGGPAYIASLVDGVPKSTNVWHYADVLADLRLRRDILTISYKLAAGVQEYDCDGRALAAEGEHWLEDVVKARGARDLQPQDDIQATFSARLEERIQRRLVLAGVPTGFAEIDRITRGFHREEVTIIAGRTSMGKSAIALNMADHAALTDKPDGSGKFRVAYFSCEMSKEQLEYRRVSARAGVAMLKILNGWVNDADVLKIGTALAELATSKLYIDDTPSATVAQIGNKCRALQALDDGLDAVFVDYLQILKPRVERFDNRYGDVSEISSDLLGTARKLKVPIVVLSQLSRKLEERKDKRPILSDLRESGSLEQDANNVAFVFRPEIYSQKPVDAGKAEYIVAKHRQGELGTVDLQFRKEIVRFEDDETTADRHLQADVPTPEE